jgi:uncharacterized membrane protein
MTPPEQVKSLPNPSSVSDTEAGEGKPSKLTKLGLFLLLLHKSSADRFWEIDALRGVAIVMMVIYHLVYDLVLFGYYQASAVTGPWRVFARVTASLIGDQLHKTPAKGMATL